MFQNTEKQYVVANSALIEYDIGVIIRGVTYVSNNVYVAVFS